MVANFVLIWGNNLNRKMTLGVGHVKHIAVSNNDSINYNHSDDDNK